MRGLALALSWLTVLPVRVAGDDVRGAAAAALRWAPLVGGLLGLLAVGLLAVATRGMHVDGLADTADGLGCYGPSERALAVMRDGGAGPFAVVTLLVVLGGQAAALAAPGAEPAAGVVGVAA